MTRAERRAERLERAREMQLLADRGWSQRAIGVQFGRSRQTVNYLLGELRGRPRTSALLTDTPRPAWSYPDATLLALARDARAAIEAAEGFKRPRL